jgi:hypothetical protein
MKRLLKIVTLFFIAMTICMPLLECFDCWDRPGLRNDTELPVFLITLFITLVLLFVLLAVWAMARRTLDEQNDRIETEIVYPFVDSLLRVWQNLTVPSLPSPPLRI